jgi:hypothetical protein
MAQRLITVLIPRPGIQWQICPLFLLFKVLSVRKTSNETLTILVNIVSFYLKLP